MRLRFLFLCSGAGIVVASLAACAGGGGATVPAGSGSAHSPGTVAAVRRTQAVPNCASGTSSSSFVGGGSGNYAAGADAAVVSGSDNLACDDESIVGAGDSNVVNGGVLAATASFIGAGHLNSVGGATLYGFIGSGNANSLESAAASGIVAGYANAIVNSYGFVGGGSSNAVSGQYGVVGGGLSNGADANYGVVGGGENNRVGGQGGFVGAGGYNNANGQGSVVGGGYSSTASGSWATIPGGYVNSASGTYSFAAGARASAAQPGTFVWSDGSDGDTILQSTAPYQFLARASGGVTFWTNAASTVGATLAPGSGSWASASDRALKTDVSRIDDAAVLDKVAALPVSRWSYRSERGVSHLGPMAQDFYAAFRVGEDDRHITSIDEDGVALAAIKALRAENLQLRQRLELTAATQGAQIVALRAALADRLRHDRTIETRLAQVSATLGLAPLKSER